MKNTVSLIGNLGSDALVREGKKGKVVSFSLATNEYRTNEKGEKEDVVTWHRIVAFREHHQKLAKYLLSGTKLGVEGKISYGSYTDKEGRQVPTAEIVADDLYLLSKKE